MKEMIYIQPDNISNYVGSHFENAQQSYFTNSGNKGVLVGHDVSFSFKEGVSLRVCHPPFVYASWAPSSDTAVGRADALSNHHPTSTSTVVRMRCWEPVRMRTR